MTYILKQIPQDFQVDETYNLETFEKKTDEKKSRYFILKKVEYTQNRAIEKIAYQLKISQKLIHFAGTKDKNAVTTQIISITNLKENWEELVKNFNENEQDLNLEYLGEYSGRINLGDNLGNKFTITVRNLTQEQIEKIKTNKIEIENNGALNFFDKQRFGFANNSHIIGKYIYQNNAELAVKEILTSCPPNPTEDLINFINQINENWEEIKNQNQEKIDKLTEICPRKFNDYKKILQHLKKAKNDFPGAFRTLFKKLRTLYINAYQSYIFNETIKDLKNKNLLKENSEQFKTIKLISHLININELEENQKQTTLKILKQDNLTEENLQLKSWPELKPKYIVERETLIKPKNLEIQKPENDELNEDKTKLKIQISFELGSGQYATNIISQLIEN